jgi:hypothetical protein
MPAAQAIDRPFSSRSTYRCLRCDALLFIQPAFRFADVPEHFEYGIHFRAEEGVHLRTRDGLCPTSDHGDRSARTVLRHQILNMSQERPNVVQPDGSRHAARINQDLVSPRIIAELTIDRLDQIRRSDRVSHRHSDAARLVIAKVLVRHIGRDPRSVDLCAADPPDGDRSLSRSPSRNS